MLEPGLPEGRVEYLFGYRQQKLFKVNVVWGVDTNPPNNNTAMLDGALRLQRYFLGFNWAQGTVGSGIPLDDRSLLLFSGSDGQSGTVTLVIENVLYERFGANIRMVPEISTGTRITIGYIDVSRDADRRRTTPNQF
jgi:hypothetical protein